MSGQRKRCAICGGLPVVDEIDSSIGPLISVGCFDDDCEAAWNNGWYQDISRAESAWDHRQIGEAAMNGVLPFSALQRSGGK